MNAILEKLTNDVIEGNDAAVADYFAAHDAEAPTLVWTPDPSQIDEPALDFLLGFWRERQDSAGLLPAKAIDPLALRPALGYIMLLDILDGGADFRYRLYGSRIAERTGFDWTGRLLSEMATNAFTGTFYAAVYRAVMRRRAPILTVSGSPRHVAATRWSRLVVPVAGAEAGEEGGVGGFIVGNLPGAWRLPR